MVMFLMGPEESAAGAGPAQAESTKKLEKAGRSTGAIRATCFLAFFLGFGLALVLGAAFTGAGAGAA